eukprot:7811678-Alexandrium_andersonii.AAC.1
MVRATQPAGMSSAATAFAATPVGGRSIWWSSDWPQRSQPGSTSQAPSAGTKSASATSVPRWQPFSNLVAATSGPGEGSPSQLWARNEA